jgi:hypothetical protein
MNTCIFRNLTDEILNQSSKNKDVKGITRQGPREPPTLKITNFRVIVVPLISFLKRKKKRNYRVQYEENTDK